MRNRLKVWIAVTAEEVAERVPKRDRERLRDHLTVRDNVVTLIGSVRRDDRDAAVAAAARAPGVVGVRDEVRVAA